MALPDLPGVEHALRVVQMVMRNQPPFRYRERKYVLHDMIDQPHFNWATQNNRGDWSLRDVSSGDVFTGGDGKPECVEHGAMNCVVADKSIWRCLMCGRATYVTIPA